MKCGVYSMLRSRPSPTMIWSHRELRLRFALYRSRNSTRIDRRHAVRELADVLEALRSEIKEEMLPKDERELFNLANGFAIRHNTRDQRKDYDDAIWLSWAFYVYLATIHAVLRLKERESKAAAVQQA